MAAERTELADAGGADPDIVILRPSQSKGGVTQKIVKVLEQGLCRVLYDIWRVCDHCEEEFCQGACLLFDYDLHQVSHQFGGRVTLLEYGWM